MDGVPGAELPVFTGACAPCNPDHLGKQHPIAQRDYRTPPGPQLGRSRAQMQAFSAPHPHPSIGHRVQDRPWVSAG